jgi:hypothetical protein
MKPLDFLPEPVKMTIGGVVTFILGIVLILTGDTPSVVTGVGTILASLVSFALLGLNTFNKGPASVAIAALDEASQLQHPKRVIWLGIALILAAGLLYLYLKYTMSPFDSGAMIFVNLPLLIAGLICLGVGFRLFIKTRYKAEPRHGLSGEGRISDGDRFSTEKLAFEDD